MRLGAFTVVDVPAEPAPDSANRALQVVGLAEAVEQAGLSSLWVAEHHFEGGGACPSPPVLLAACGMRTRRIRLGSLVSVLPFHRPVDLAEEYALLDRLLEGRLNLGIGSGYLASEFAGYGLDPGEKRERFDAALSNLREAFAGRPIQAGGPSVPPVRLNVTPVQRPHPPLWVAVQRREALPHVARQGLSVALIPYATVASLDELAEVIREYREASPPGAKTEVVAAVHLYAGAEVAAAQAAFRRYVDSRLRTGSTFLVRKTRDHPEHADPEALERSGLALFGRPDEVVQRAAAFERAGVDELLGIFDFGGLPPRVVDESVRAVGAAWSRREPLAPVADGARVGL